MMLAILADIHGNSEALSKVLDDINNQGIKNIVILGDLVIKGTDPKGFMTIIGRLNPTCCIKGNTDKWFEEISNDWKPSSDKEVILYDCYRYTCSKLENLDLKEILRLPEKQRVTFANKNILCVHGSPRHINEQMTPELTEADLDEIIKEVDEDIILSGHVHRAYVRRYKDKIIVNPGAVGLCNYDGDISASYAIMTISDDNIDIDFRKVKYNHDKVIQYGKKNDYPHISEYYKKLMEY